MPSLSEESNLTVDKLIKNCLLKKKTLALNIISRIILKHKNQNKHQTNQVPDTYFDF